MVDNKNIFIFLSTVLIVAIISGSIFTLTIKQSDFTLTSEFIAKYLDSIVNNTFSIKTSLINTLISNIGVLLIIFLLSFSIIGVPVILIIFFYRSFIIGFSISSILMNYKIKGILFSILYVFPHQIINIIILMYMIIYSIIISYKLIKAVVNRCEISFRTLSRNYFYFLLFSICIFLITGLYESILMPKLIKVFIKLII